MDAQIVGEIWGILLTAGLAIMAYFIKKRDDAIDDNRKGIKERLDCHTSLELKLAENYATKSTVMALFSETARNHEAAIARVEKRIDETNSAIIKQGDKIDKVADNINSFQTNVMSELSKKT